MDSGKTNTSTSSTVKFGCTTSGIGVSFPNSLCFSPSLLALLLSQKTRLSISVIMAAKTESDYESDEEFEERTSNELWSFYFGGFVDVANQLEHELGKKRFDRVERIIENLRGDSNRFSPKVVSELLCGLTMTALQFMHAAGCPETLQFIFSHFAENIPEYARQRLVLQAALYGGDDSVDTLRCFVGDSFVRKVISDFKDSQLRSELCCKLIQASMRGDMEEVERCLATEWSDMHLFCSHVNEYAVKAAADHGHMHIVNTLFVKWGWISRRCERQFIVDFRRDEVLWSACRDDNLELAVSTLFAGDDFMRSNQSLSLVPCNCLPIRPEVFGTAEFLRKVISAIVDRLDRLGHKLNPGGKWLKMVLANAIKLSSRPHVEVLLDKMDPNQSGDIFTDHPWLMPAVFQSRCASILRCILIRYPEAAIRNAECDPAVVINSYHWPAGARLLVEAGAKCKGSVPAEHSGILTLSLEDRCRIAVRRSLKSPLSENVKKLPLPAKAKRRLLYQYGRVKDTYDK